MLSLTLSEYASKQLPTDDTLPQASERKTQQELLVHRMTKEQSEEMVEEGSSECDYYQHPVEGTAEGTSGETDSVRDERLEDLEQEVAALQDCLEVAEAHVDKVQAGSFLLNSIRNPSKLNQIFPKVEAELLKEKSKVELIERELKSREQIMRVVISEKNRQASIQLGTNS